MIAIDAMGGDYAPHAIVQGAYNAGKRGIPLTLFGDALIIQHLLDEQSFRHSYDWRRLPISVIHCSARIEMGEEPSRSVIQKKDSSLVQAVQSVAQGNAVAVVSAGNSGAALVAGTLLLGRAHDILRPAIGNFLPTKKSSIFCIDLGANTDCKADYLEQFACMGHTFVRIAKNIEAPRIALLSNGSEPYKGSAAVKQVYDRLKALPLNFIGNIEPRDVFDDRADVLVCDGFAGNIFLKTMQGTAKAMVSWIDQERSTSWFNSLGLLLSKSLWKNLKRKIDYAQKGGALLLGVKHPLIIAHGCSNAVAIENAIVMAHTVAHERVIPRFNEQFTTFMQRAVAYSSMRPHF